MRCRVKCDDGPAEIREILTDWYNMEMHCMDKRKSVQRLTEVFESDEVKLYP